MLWFGLWGCGAELLSVSLQQSSEAVVAGLPEVPDIPEEIDPSVLPDGVDPDDLDTLGLRDWISAFDTALLAEQGLSEGDVSDMRITRLTIEAIDPPGAEVSFVDALELWIGAEGLPEIRLAALEQRASGRTELSLDDVDLSPYLTAPAVTFRTAADGLPPVADTTLRATVEIEAAVTAAGVIGQLRAR